MCRRALGAVASLGAILLGASCRNPTEIRVVLTSDACARLTGDGVSVSVGPALGALGDAGAAATTAACEDASRGSVGSIVLVPSSGDDEPVALEVQMRVGADADCAVPRSCIVARRALRYVPHTPLTLPIALASACNGVACAADETCVEGGCVSATLSDPEAGATPGRCDTRAQAFDGSAAADAPPAFDATIDASVTPDARPADAATGGDATDASCALAANARPFSPGTVDCPTAPCATGSTCCAPGGGLGACYTQCTSPVKACDEPADCRSGQVCCAINYPMPVETVFTCKASCAQLGGGGVQVCKSDCDCPGTPCLLGAPCGIMSCGGVCPP